MKTAVKLLLTTTASVLFLQNTYALDSACDPIVSSMDKLAQQPALRKTTASPIGTITMIEVDNIRYVHIEGQGDDWESLPEADPQGSYKKSAAALRSGEISISSCQNIGTEEMNGIQMTIVSYQTELKISEEMIFNIENTGYYGINDNLPYKVIMKSPQGNSTTTYQYKGVLKPKG